MQFICAKITKKKKNFHEVLANKKKKKLSIDRKLKLTVLIVIYLCIKQKKSFLNSAINDLIKFFDWNVR